jgi:hypothetical protein
VPNAFVTVFFTGGWVGCWQFLTETGPRKFRDDS